MAEWLLLALSVLLIGACGLFVAGEFALLTVDRSAVQRAADGGDRSAKGVLKALGHLSTELAGVQVAITVTNLAVGFLSEPAIATLLHSPLRAVGITGGGVDVVAVAIALVVSTVLTMVFGELVPKNLAIARPLAVARAVQAPVRAFTRAMGGPIRLLNRTADALLHLVGLESQEEFASARSPDELLSLVRHSQRAGTLEAGTATLLVRSLTFDDKHARDVLTARPQMITVDRSATVDAFLDTVRASGRSRLPVTGPRGLDDVVGILELDQAVAVPVNRRARVRAAEIMGPVVEVPETLGLGGVLEALHQGRSQLAIVVDEYGGTAGLLTGEDLLEELVGDLDDEHDQPARPVQRIATGFDVSGLLRPDEVTAATGHPLPERGVYETVGGLVMHELGRLPEQGDVVDLGDTSLRVLRMDGRRVDRVEVSGGSGARPVVRCAARGIVVNTSVGLVVTVLLLAANAFFVGAEFALVSAKRATIEPRAEAGSRRAIATLRAMERVSIMLAGAQLGITLCSVALGALSEPAIAHLLEGPFAAIGIPDGAVHPVAFVIALLLITVLHVLFGEMVPKNIALAAPERSSLWLSPALAWTVKVAKPVLWLLNGFSNLVLRAVRVEPKDEVASAFTRDEVASMVEESHRGGLLDSTDRVLLGGALAFETATAADVALPLDRVHSLAPDPTPRAVEELAARTGVTRFPIRAADGAGLTGYVHVKDTLPLPATDRERPVPVDCVRLLPDIPADAALGEAIEVMRGNHAHMARVSRAAGELRGIVTLDDILASLIGAASSSAG